MSGRMLLRIAMVLLAVSAVAVVATSDVPGSAEELRARILSAGPLGAALFVAAFTVLQAMGLSAHVFIVAASLVWPAPTAILLSWLGTLGSSAAAFVFARTVGREMVQARLTARMRRYDERLEQRGFRTVLVLRLLFFSSPWLHLLLGVSRVTPSAYFLGTAVGNAPTVVLVTLLGAGAAAWIAEHDPGAADIAALAACAALLAGLGYLLVRRLRARSQAP